MRRPEANQLVAELERVGLNPPAPIHLPAPSYYPFIVGLAIPIIGYGIIYHDKPFGIPLLVLGGLMLLGSFIGWGVEPLEEVEEHGHDEHEIDAEHGEDA